MRGDRARGRRGRDDEELTPEDLARLAYAQSIKLLGARDHSSVELRTKLAQRDFDETAIDAALAELREANYVDDDRYARTFAEQLLRRGRGPMAIRNKLRERGIEGDLAGDAVEALGADWVEHAQATLEGRFAPDAIADDEPKAKARIARFLQSRGFGSGDALRALDRARKRIERESLADD